MPHQNANNGDSHDDENVLVHCRLTVELSGGRADGWTGHFILRSSEVFDRNHSQDPRLSSLPIAWSFADGNEPKHVMEVLRQAPILAGTGDMIRAVLDYTRS